MAKGEIINQVRRLRFDNGELTQQQLADRVDSDSHPVRLGRQKL
jgi:hypothetical protein